MIQQATQVSKIMFSELNSGWNFWFCEIRETVKLSYCSKKVFYKTLYKSLHKNAATSLLRQDTSDEWSDLKTKQNKTDITFSLGQLIAVPVDILTNIFILEFLQKFSHRFMQMLFHLLRYV